MSESAKRYLVIFTYVVLISSTLLVFWQVRNFDFLNYDDDWYVHQNPHVLSGLAHGGIIWAFTTGYASNWHPLTWLSHMLDCQVFGPNPGWMHFVNLLLHLANTLLLFAILKKLTGSLWPSAFVAAAFALHPMHVESVAWIAERKDVLSTFFLLLTLAAYVAYVKRPSIFRYVITLVLFAFGLMAKPMLVTLPFLLLLLDYWPLGRFAPDPMHDGRKKLRWIIIEKIPFFVLAAASSAVTFLVQRGGRAVININALPLKDRVANAFLSYARYMGQMFWPHDLAAFYPFYIGSSPFWQVAFCALLLLVISIFVARFGRKQKYLSVGWFWFLCSLVPVIGLVQVGEQSMADRYTYIPYIGLFIMVAWGLPELLSKLPYRNLILGSSMVIMLAALGVCAHRQASYWKNSITLFSHAIEVTQDNHVAYSDRGAAYIGLGRWQEAIDDLRQAVRIKPDYSREHNNLGIAYGRLGRYQDAIDAYKQAIRIKPDYAEAHYNLGVAYRRLGRLTDAIDAYKLAIKIRPDYADARYSLANELTGQGRYDEAVSQYREVLRLRPDWPDCMNNLALLIATRPDIRNRDTNEAVRLARGACEFTNNKKPAYLGTLAAAYAAAGRFDEAVATTNKAMDLADATNQPQIKNVVKYHLSFYKQGKPYIEPAPKSPPDPNKP